LKIFKMKKLLVAKIGEDRALRSCPVDIFSEWASWRAMAITIES